MRLGKVIVMLIGLSVLITAAEAGAASSKPVIEKLGTIDCDMVETTPIVFNGRLYRMEWVRRQLQTQGP